MLREVKPTPPPVRQNFLDKAIAWVAPVAAARRMRSRLAMSFFNAYDGASKKKRSLKEWSTFGSDADTDILGDLGELRNRSRDLVRNNPIAAGAIKTKVTNVVGTGLRFQSRIDRDVLNLTDDQADAIESVIEREWRLFWESKDCDVTRIQNGHGLTSMVYQQSKENGDVLVLLPNVVRQGFPYGLKLQVVEADRLCNENQAIDTDKLAGGVEKDEHGAPVKYHILQQHPGALLTGGVNLKWDKIDAFGKKTGLRNVIHLYKRTRPGQSRGVPDLAPVIEPLKQLGRYTEAEIMAAVISGFFTVFIETESGGVPGTPAFDYSNMGNETGQASSDRDMKLGNGMIIELGQGEKISDANPGRPNATFDPFVQSILRQIGTALEIPFELLIKHFTASYSAARAALLEMWKFVLSERKWLTDDFLKIVFEVWMWEAVAIGRVPVPGFFADPAIRQAYLGCTFIGPSKGQINELAEVNAAAKRVEHKLSTLSDETAELTGRDWETNHRQQVKEHKKQIADGLKPDPEKEKENGQGNQD